MRGFFYLSNIFCYFVFFRNELDFVRIALYDINFESAGCAFVREFISKINGFPRKENFKFSLISLLSLDFNFFYAAAALRKKLAEF